MVDRSSASARARVIAPALALGLGIDLWSLALVAVALIGFLALSLPLASKLCLLLSILAGGAQKILALRVAFDAALFRQWAEAWASPVDCGVDQTTESAELAALDQVLAVCGLRAPPVGAVRDLECRIRGAWRLLRQQVWVFTIQFAAMIAAGLALQMLPY